MDPVATSDGLVAWINETVGVPLRSRAISKAALELALRERIDEHFDLKAVRGQRGSRRRPRGLTRRAVVVIAELCAADPLVGLLLWDACIETPSGGRGPTLIPTAVAPVFGREKEVAAVLDALTRATEHRSAQSIFVFGSQGIGKTSVVSAVAREATSLGVEVAWLDSTLPGLSSLENVVRDDLAAYPAGTEPVGVRRLEELFEERLQRIVGSVLRSSVRQRMLLILEDLHRADVVLVQGLHRLAAEDLPCALVLLFTAQPPAAWARPDVAALIEMCDAGFQLDELDAGSFRRLVASHASKLSRSAQDDLVSAIAPVTGRHPGMAASLLKRFLVDGTWRAGVDSGTVGSAARQAAEVHWASRISRLASTTQDCLRAAAVIGTRFDLRLLRLLPHLRRHEPELAWAVSEAVESGIVEEDGSAPGRFRFVHEWAQLGALVDAPPWVLAELHRQTADALTEWGEALEADELSRMVKIARHLEMAVSGYADGVEALLSACVVATQCAMDRFEVALAREIAATGLRAVEPGSRYLRSHATLLLLRGELEPGLVQRSSYLVKAVWTELTGDEPRVELLVDWLTEYLLAVPVGVADPEANSMRDRIRALIDGGDGALESQLLAGEAQQLLVGPHPDLAVHKEVDRLLDRAEELLAMSAGRGEAERAVTRARSLAAEIRPGAAEAVHRAGRTRGYGGSFGAFYGIDHAVDLRAMFHAAARSGDRTGMLRAYESFRSVADERPWLVDSAFADMLQAFIALADGRFDNAREVVNALEQLLVRDDPNLGILAYTQRMWLLMETDRTEARRSSEIAVQLAPQFAVSRAVAAVLHAYPGGDPSRSRELIASVLDDGIGALPYDITRSICLPCLAEAAVLLDGRKWATELWPALAEYRSEILVGPTATHAHGAADRYLAMLCPSVGRPIEDAIALFESALDLERQLASPALEARTLYWYGRTVGRSATDEDSRSVAIDRLEDALQVTPAGMVDLRADVEREITRHRTRPRRKRGSLG